MERLLSGDGGGFMTLAGTFVVALVVLAYLTVDGIEGVADGNVNVFMPVVAFITLNDELMAGDLYVDPYIVKHAMGMAVVWLLNDDAAADDMIIVLLELFGAFTNALLGGVGVVHVVKRNLQGNLHQSLYFFGCPLEK